MEHFGPDCGLSAYELPSNVLVRRYVVKVVLHSRARVRDSTLRCQLVIMTTSSRVVRENSQTELPTHLAKAYFFLLRSSSLGDDVPTRHHVKRTTTPLCRVHHCIGFWSLAVPVVTPVRVYAKVVVDLDLQGAIVSLVLLFIPLTSLKTSLS
jgi:hypothetical protein